MKKIVYILIALTFLVSACDNGFDELNVDPTKPNQVDAKFKLPVAQLNISGGRYENWRANLIYCSTMMQHFSSLTTYWSGDKYLWNKGYASSLIDSNVGSAVKDLQDIMVQLEAEKKPAEMKAIVRILRVFVFHRLTDLYGDIPYFEAGRAVINPNPGEAFIYGSLTPKYDPQKDIYADMLKELDEAVKDLGTGGTSQFGDADIMFKGDLGKWKRFANSMMLRLGFRLIKVAPEESKKWVTKAINGGVMTSNEDIAYIQHTNGPEGINKNGNGEVFTTDKNMRMSKTFIDFLQDDPRLPILAQRKEDGNTDPANLKGLPNGLNPKMFKEQTGLDNSNSYAEPNRNIITGEDAPMFFQSYAEVEFMLAEAAVRWGLAGGDPKPHYEKGVEAAMKMLALYGDAAIISDDAIAAYLEAKPFDPAKALEQINTQYWAATFLNEYEAYANWRRVEYPVLVPTNYPGNETGGTIPRRLTYSTSEQSNNAANYEEAIKRQGPDKLTTRVWWDKE